MGIADLRARELADGVTLVSASGQWVIANSEGMDRLLRQIRPGRGGAVRVDLSEVERLDTTGAWLLSRAFAFLVEGGASVETVGLKSEQAALLERLRDLEVAPLVDPKKLRGLGRMAERTGRFSLYLVEKSGRFIGFVGLVTIALAAVLVNPRRLRLTSFVVQIERTGLTALPIVGLISFLIGVVMAYQGASQLEQFGAQIFVVNLIAVSILRELGIMLTAIVVAGRSGSAFTAQLGAMKVNQEIDALRALGMDPIEVLVVPRILALVVSLPLLGFFADIMGLFGGALMAWAALGISPLQFLARLQEAAGFWTVMVGIIKAPVFALMIGLVGCYEGLRVEGSAESVGKLTTRAVVESIFLVIVVDALFSILFSFLRI
jgi:phospholipid/cholesterol/gamma-HCH transport system permease protein